MTEFIPETQLVPVKDVKVTDYVILYNMICRVVVIKGTQEDNIIIEGRDVYNWMYLSQIYKPEDNVIVPIVICGDIAIIPPP